MVKTAHGSIHSLNKVTISGFFADSVTWDEVEDQWGAVNKLFGVPCFHATALNGGKDEYDGWLKAARDEYSAKLPAIISGQSKRLGACNCGMRADAYGRIIDHEGQRKLGSPWFACFKNCIAMIAKYMETLPESGTFSVAVEKGSGFDVMAVNYVAFGNKQELFRTALQRYLATEVSFIQEALSKSTACGVGQRLLQESALFLSRSGFPRRCMTIQASQVITEEGAQIHKELVELRVRSQKKLRDRLSRAKREGDLPFDARPDSLARFLVSIYQGMTIQSVNGASRRELLDLAETSSRAWPMTKAA